MALARTAASLDVFRLWPLIRLLRHRAIGRAESPRGKIASGLLHYRPKGADVAVITAFVDREARLRISMPSATDDPEVDAIAIRFAPEGARHVGRDEVAPGLVLDYDAQGRVIGIELLYVRELLATGRIGAARARPNAADEPHGFRYRRALKTCDEAALLSGQRWPLHRTAA
ncbi:MAG TPA: DUF2283 domain-containing protein [Acetobacteraceae bacterium]|nr:DUF2283 domain-containing protein [Acetobacteraceae bacterium]